MGKEDIAVLVMSCDAYYDTWEGFIKAFRHFFKGCPYSIYLCKEQGSNDKYMSELEYDKCIITDENLEWSGRLKYALNQIDADFVLLMLDDFWLNGSVLYDEFEKDVLYLMNNIDIGSIYINHAKFLRLHPFSNRYGEIMYSEMYRANTRPALWRKSCLYDFIKENETIWQFERLGSERVPEHYKILVTYKQYFPFISAIDVRKWNIEAFKLANKLGFEINSQRLKNGLYYRLKFKLRCFIFNLFPEVISRIRRKSIT